MRYDPTTVWAATWEWFHRQPERQTEIPVQIRPAHARLILNIYREDQPGAWRLSGPKLYWHGDLNQSAYQNCEQDELWEHRDWLGHVVLTDRILRTTKLWQSWQAFADDIGLSRL